MVAVVCHFCHYVLQFTTRTDYTAFQWLLTFWEQEGQVACWTKQLQPLNYQIKHQAGEHHTNANEQDQEQNQPVP